MRGNRDPTEGRSIPTVDRVSEKFIYSRDCHRMILIIAASILGAAVGLFVQPRLFAIAMALSLSGAAHLVLGFLAQIAAKSPNRQALAEQLALVTTTDVHGIWPVMAAGGAGSILAAILWSLTERQSTDVFWFLPNEGDRRNGVRSMALVENRDGVHDEAKRRLDSMLER